MSNDDARKWWDTYPISEEMGKRIENDFTYHSSNSLQVEKYAMIRDMAKDWANILVHVCPPSRELSLALTNLEQAVMWANASIARNE